MVATLEEAFSNLKDDSKAKCPVPNCVILNICQEENAANIRNFLNQNIEVFEYDKDKNLCNIKFPYSYQKTGYNRTLQGCFPYNDGTSNIDLKIDDKCNYIYTPTKNTPWYKQSKTKEWEHYRCPTSLPNLPDSDGNYYCLLPPG